MWALPHVVQVPDLHAGSSSVAEQPFRPRHGQLTHVVDLLIRIWLEGSLHTQHSPACCRIGLTHRAILDPDELLRLLSLRVGPGHVRWDCVADEADFARLLDHSHVVVVEVLVVVDLEVAGGQRALCHAQWVQLLAHVPPAQRVACRNQEVAQVAIYSNGLAQGRTDLQYSALAAEVAEQEASARLRVDLKQLVVEEQDVDEAIFGVHCRPVQPLPLRLLALGGGIGRLVGPLGHICFICLIWVELEDVSLQALCLDLLLRRLSIYRSARFVDVKHRLGRKV